MPVYPPGVPQPGDPGDAAAARGLSVRVVLLALIVCLSGAIAVTGARLTTPEIDTPTTLAAVPAPDPTLRAAVPHVRPSPATSHGSVGRPLAAAPAPAHKAPKPARHQHRRPARPWLPSGTGVWVHEWASTMHGNARAIVARARRHGVSTLYVRTATNAEGYDGRSILSRLLPATRGTDVHVVAWDFPTLRHPTRDARRLARAARYHPPGKHTPRVRAVAPDIETAAEGTRTSRARVHRYLKALRRQLPKQVSILTTVPWPSEVRRGHYPYRTAARGSDALLPMTYWYNRSPGIVTSYSIRWLRHLHKPVLPIGQGFDSKLDAPYLRHSNQRREIASFMLAARRAHVRAVSLWSWQTAGPAQWVALWHNRGSFHPQPHR